MNARSDIFIADKLTENRSSLHLLVMCQTPVFDPLYLNPGFCIRSGFC